MVNNENDIFKTIKHHIAKCFIENKPLSVDGLMAIAAVSFFHFLPPVSTKELLSAINKNGQIDTTFDTFKDRFSKYLKQEKRNIEYLKQLNQEGLRQYLLKNWIEELPLNDKLSCCKKINIIDMQADQVIPLLGKENVYQTYAKEGMNQISSDIFGTEDYKPEPFPAPESPESKHPIFDSITDTHEDKSVSAPKSSAKAEPKRNTTQSRDQQRYEQEKRILQLYTTIIEKSEINKHVESIFPEEVSIQKKEESIPQKKVRYVWQLEIPFSEWQIIKQIAETNANILNEWERSVESARDKAIAAFVLIYAAEWNKREWTGNDRDNNLGKIIPSKVAEKVVRTLRKYRPQYPFPCVEFEDERHNRWLDALKVQGGLPLRYIFALYQNEQSSPYYTYFRWLLNHSNNELDASQMRSITNKTYKYSFDQLDSIYDYAQAIQEHNYPFEKNERVSEQDEQTTFAIIQTILANMANNKFDYSWHVIKYGPKARVGLQIQLRNEDNMDSSNTSNYIMSEKRLKMWMGEDDSTRLPHTFPIEFKQDDQSLLKINFDKRTDGSWMPRASYKHRYEVVFNNKKKIEIYIDGKRTVDSVYNSKQNGGYQVMYSDNHIDWYSNSLSSKKAFLGCLIFDTEKYHNTHGLSELDGEYSWVDSEDNHSIVLVDNNNKKTILRNRNDELCLVLDDSELERDYIITSECCYMQSINKQENADEEYEEELISIPFGNIIRTNTIFTPLLKNDISESKIEEKKIKVKEGDKEYQLGELPLGYHTFTFDYEGKQMVETYFILPKDFELDIIPNSSLIQLKGIDKENVAILEDASLRINDNGKILFDSKRHHALKYTLRIAIGMDNLDIPIIPPYEENIEVYLLKDENNAVPQPAFYNRRRYTTQGTEEISAEQLGLNFNQFSEKIQSKTKLKNFNYNRQTQRLTVNAEVYTNKEQYRFYFFDGNREDLLTVQQNDNSLCLADDPFWENRKGVIVQSYEDLSLHPSIYYNEEVINQWRPKSEDYLNVLLFVMKHRCWYKNVLGDAFQPILRNKNNVQCCDIAMLGKLLTDYFDYCTNHRTEIRYNELWRLAKEYKFEWLYLWRAMHNNDAKYMDRYFKLLVERDASPQKKKNMKFLLTKMKRANNLDKSPHNQSKRDDSVHDLLKLMYHTTNRNTNMSAYEIGSAGKFFDDQYADKNLAEIEKILTKKLEKLDSIEED